MFWWLVIAAGIFAALVYAYRLHRRDSGRLAAIFVELSETHGGEVERGTWLVLPKFRFERGGRPCLLTAMATDGTKGSAAFTCIELELPGDCGEKIRIRPKSRGTRILELPVTSGGRLSTGDREFDAAFRITGKNQAFASSLLGVDVRQSMLASDTPALESRVERNKIMVTMEGIAGSTKEIEVLIETACLLADHCPLVGSTAD